MLNFAKNRNKFKIYSNELLLAAFLIISQLSVLWSINPSSSFVWLLKIILDLTVYFVFSRINFKKKTLDLILLAFILNTLYEIVLAFMQFINGGLLGIPIIESISRIDIERIYYYTFGSSIFRVVGTLSHPNMLSGYLTLLIPFVFALIIMRPYKAKIIYLIITPMITATILMTFSRWGLITFIFSVFISLLLFRKISKEILSKVTDDLKIGLLFSVSVILFLILNPFIFSRFFYFSTDDASLATRVSLLSQAKFVLQQNPLGIGGGASAAYLANFDVTSTQISTRYLPTVHEFYFLVATEIGIVGLFLFLLFIVSIIKGFYVNFEKIKMNQKVMGVAIICSILIFLFNGLWEPKPLGDRIGLFLFLIMGLLVNITHQKKLPISKTS
ncbi:MAG TPA: O-antigen ligase family protein [Patescibacteria group bacterium]|nr:O-antigen ligase family protein [Patescibacteria group bacterium]